MFKSFLGLYIILILLLSSSVIAVEQLTSLQGRVEYEGTPVSTGDIQVTLWDNATGGNLIYNSSSDFYGAIVDGYFDVMLGSITTLDLNYNQHYWCKIT